MHTEMPSHHGDVDLSWEQVLDALGAFVGSRVTVRVVERSDPEMLLTVLEGKLEALSHSKHPALFWPVCHSDQGDGLQVEIPGFYLRRDRFEGSVGRAGCTVLVIMQGPVLINIRQS